MGVYVCMCACMYVCNYVCIYACLHVCMYLCIYVCMYVGTAGEYLAMYVPYSANVGSGKH